MTPVVSDELAGALRVLCLLDFKAFRERNALVADEEAGRVGIRFYATAFMLALERKFKDESDFEILKFVAENRAQSDSIADDVDPDAAEAVIRYGLRRLDSIDLDRKTRRRIQFDVLIWLLMDFRMHGDEADMFVARVRRLTDRHFARLAELEGSG